jgi:hypothetical protein
MSKIMLFQLKTPNIKITIEAYFEGEKLVIDGYDIGKTVEESWGDSDYEYVTTIPEIEVKKLYPLMNVLESDKEGLLKAIAGRFNTNTCYSEFNDFLRANNISSEGFSWT